MSSTAEKKMKHSSTSSNAAKSKQIPSSISIEQISNSVVIIREESHHEARLSLDKRLKELVTNGVQPISYEDELVSCKKDIKRDPLNDILVFPQHDVTLFKRSRELRTEYSTVPPQAFKDATSLFVTECLKVYTCEHYILEKKYIEYGGSYANLKKSNLKSAQESFQKSLFEVDVELDETDGGNDSMLVPTKENGIYKEGYLTKSPFHSDGNPLFGNKLVESAIAKTYKRRWFTLKQTSNDGSYILEYRKEEGSAFAKGTLYLDSCTQIRKGVKGRMYGFELHIQDKIYGLAADSLSEMEKWIKSLCRATGIEIEQEKPLRALFAGKLTQPKHKNLRDSLKNSSHPLLQEFAKETDQGNLKNRKENRTKLFSTYPDINNSYGVGLNSVPEPTEPFRESLGFRFKLHCKELNFKLCNQAPNGKTQNCEPFFLTLALFDIREGRKISEDFSCDLNGKALHDILNSDSIENGSDASKDQKKDQEKSFPHECVFSVDVPHPDIFLVLRINKILQGGITQCTEPYIKAYDNPKTSQKVTKQIKLVSKRLCKLQMPFGWAARTIFKSTDGDLDQDSEFTPIYKQESSKLADEELIKSLQDLKGESKLNRLVIPGSIHCNISTLVSNFSDCYSPSLIPLKPFSRSQNDVTPKLEIQTFSQRKIELASPYTEYVNNFYVYPISLNYGSQKAFKARNISCTIQFKDSDEISAKPLKCIYQRDGTCSFTHQVTCPVLYHNTTPTFYEEIKILLPPQLEAKHHILFTFNHVSVEVPKDGKENKKDVLTPVGYCWLPILEEGIARGDESNVPVALYLPEGYMTNENLGLGKQTGPDIKWADGKGQSLFRVKTRLLSTIYSQDLHINKFFSHWQVAESKQTSSHYAETSRLLKLMHAADVYVVVKFLPVLLNQLFKVLIQVNNEDVAVNVVSLLIRITSMMHEADKSRFLKSYVAYMYQVDTVNGRTVHEELSKHLIFFLKLGADPTMIANILQHSWFFFDIMVKSMAHSHMNKQRTDKSSPDTRQTRFKSSFLTNLENLMQVFIYQLVSKAKDKPAVVKEANKNLGAFIKDCTSHMDRGNVFEIINYLKDQYQPADTQMMELKFDFLRSVCEHEHYIALNLPLDIRMKGDVHESTLSDNFCRKHFLVGLLLKEISDALYQPKVIRKYALKVFRNLLVKHELDDRYNTEEKQSRIVALYIPFLTMMLEHSLRFHKNMDRPIIDDSFLSLHRIGGVVNENLSPLSKRTSAQSNSLMGSPSVMSLDPTGKIPPILPFDDDESKEFMMCFLYIIKNLKSVVIVDWWRDILSTPIKRPQTNPTVLYYMQHEKHFAKFMAIIDFFDVIEVCIKIFKYHGMKHTEEKSLSTSDSARQFLETKHASISKASPRLSAVLTHKRGHSTSSLPGPASPTLPDVGYKQRAVLESNLSTEIAITSLDMLELFCQHFKFHLEQDDGNNILMKKLFNVLMTFLRIGQSEIVLKHVFASLRSFIHKFPTALFKGNANLCGILCYEIIRLCNAKIQSIRTQAVSFMYLLMRSNFEYSGSGCVRVHHQIIIAVSKLIASGMNRSSMSQSLITLKNYSVDDKGLKSTEFPGEVRDLIKKVHTVLQATAQMKEHEDDLEVLVDLQYSLAKSYSSTPELRQTWLQSIAYIHEKIGDYSEAAMCYIHAAALVAEYLKGAGSFPSGCSVFKPISPNLLPDESTPKDEGSVSEVQYTHKHLLDLLEISIDRLKLAERYEVMGEVYKLAIPLYEQDRNYRCLALAYGTLKESYEKIVEVMVSGKRVLGRYYRVAFYGRVFKTDDGKEFIYKEPKLTSLPEISMRLNEKYEKKYGNVKLIQDSAKVKPEELNPAVNYIQVTFVTPYFDEEEYVERLTEFEREHNIRRFVFETPFTLSGKARGALSEQHKRKTILTTSHCFPYVKKRILVVQQEQYELSPIEVAIDEMQSKVKELNQVIALDPPDMKKLQLKLAGSVSVQVNAGPLAYAETFLEENVVKNYMVKHVEALQTVYRAFVTSCGQAIELNAVLIKPDQKAYHADMEQRYNELSIRVASYLGEETSIGFTTVGLPAHSEV